MAFTVGTTVITPTPQVATGGLTSKAITLGSTTPGDLNVIVFTDTSASTTATTVTTPAGWTKAGEHSMSASATPYVGIFWRIYQSGDGTSVTFNWTTGATVGVHCIPISGADTTAPVPASSVAFQNRASTTTVDTIAATTADAGYVFSGAANKTGGSYTNADTLCGLFSTGSATITSVVQRETTPQSAGYSVSKSFTGASSSIGFAFSFVVVPASTGTPATAAGTVTFAGAATAVAGGNSAAGTVTLTGATAGRAATTAAGTVAFSGTAAATSPITTWFNNPAVRYVAHRGGYASTLGEETLEAYTAAAAQYSDALLEISFWYSSDGVAVASHDQMTGTPGHVVFNGANLDITANTWATLSTKTTVIGGYAIQRVSDIIAAFPTRLFLLDNKSNTNNSTRASALDALAPGRLAAKQIVGGYAWLNTCAALGWPVWDYGYNTDTANFATNITTNLGPALASGVPVRLGFGDYSSGAPSQSDTTSFATAAAGAGLQWWAHIIGTTTQKNDALTKGTTAGLAPVGYMVSGFSAVAPTDTGAATAVGAVGFTGAVVARAAAASAGVVAVTGTAAATGAVGSAGAVSFTATVTARAAAISAGSVSFTAAAAAQAATGTNGQITFTGTAAASTASAATSHGVVVFTGTATAGTAGAATSHGVVVFAGVATAGGGTPTPGRDIDITVTRLPDPWQTTGVGSPWSFTQLPDPWGTA